MPPQPRMRLCPHSGVVQSSTPLTIAVRAAVARPQQPTIPIPTNLPAGTPAAFALGLCKSLRQPPPPPPTRHPPPPAGWRRVHKRRRLNPQSPPSPGACPSSPGPHHCAQPLTSLRSFRRSTARAPHATTTRAERSPGTAANARRLGRGAVCVVRGSAVAACSGGSSSLVGPSIRWRLRRCAVQLFGGFFRVPPAHFDISLTRTA